MFIYCGIVENFNGVFILCSMKVDYCDRVVNYVINCRIIGYS